MDKRFCFSTCNIDSKFEKIIGFTNLDNIPFELSLSNFVMEPIIDIKNYNPRLTQYTSEMLVINGIVYRCSGDGKQMLIMDLNHKDCRYINIDLGKDAFNSDTILGMYRSGKNVLIVPRFYRFILMYNSNDDSLTTIDICDNKFEVDEIGAIFSFSFFYREKIIIFSVDGMHMGIFDIQSKKMQWIKYSPTSIAIEYAIYRKNKIYASDRCGVIYEISMENNSIKTLFNKLNGEDYIMSRFVFLDDEEIVFFPFRGDEIYKIDLDKKECIKIKNVPIDIQYLDGFMGAKYWNYLEDKNYYYFPPKASQYLLVIDKNNGNIKWIKCGADDIKKSIFMRPVGGKGMIINEDKTIGLCDMLEHLKNEKS